MTEKAIERFSPTSALNELGDRYHYMIEQPAGSWMRYDAELVRDAMRYRWLRSRATASWSHEFGYYFHMHVSNWPDGDQSLDTAIDTAISQSEGAQR